MKKQLSLGKIFVSFLLLLLILPLSMVMIFFLMSSYNAAKSNITNRINTVSAAAASGINSKIETPYRFLVSIADLAEETGFNDTHIKAMLNSGIKSYRAFEAIYLLNNDKTVADANLGSQSSYSKDDFIGIKFSDIPDTPDIKTSWSRPQRSFISGMDILRVTVRFKGGYVVGDINLNYIRDAINDNYAEDYTSVTLVNSFGDVLASKSTLFSTNNISNHPLMDIRKTGYHMLFGYKNNDILEIGSIHKLQTCDWYLIYEEPLLAAFQYYREILTVTIISLVLLVTFSLVVLYFIRIKLITPLHLLTKRSEMIAEGQFISFNNAEKNSFKELSALYDSFEKMAITIDKREKELKDKEEYLRSVFDSTTNTGLLIISMDDEPVITDANMGAQNIFGYRLTELLGLPISGLMKNLNDTLNIMCDETRRTGAMVAESLEMIKKNGAAFPVICSISPLCNFSGSLQGFIGVITDITETTKVKNELESEKERLDVTLKSIGEGVVAADSRGRIILVNSSAENILGQKSRFLMAHNIDDVLQIYDYDTGRLMTDRVTDFSVTTSKTYRANMVTHDGSVITVYITSSAMKNASGSTIGSVYVFRDITERMQMEQELINRKKQLEEVNRDLERRVSDETEKRRKNEQMLFEQAKFAAMGQMISAIAHQWRQPLNALALYVQDIEDAHDNGEADKQYLENFTGNAMKLIDHMSGTIDDFRNFFHSANVPELSDVTAVVIDSLSLVTTQLRSHMINFIITINSKKDIIVFDNRIPEEYQPPNDIRIMIFPSELKQVILNIVQNARYAIDDRRKDSPHMQGMINIVLNYKTDRLRIDISNNGGNIPENVLGRIFEPYFTTKPEGEGTGIGLYMSKTMIEDHMNGLLVAENIPNGAKFSITLGYKAKLS